MTDVEVPAYREMMWATILGLRELGGSGSIDELVATVLKIGEYTEAQQAVLHNDGPGTKLAYQIQWARTNLKGIGLATNSERGVWSLTEDGRNVSEHEVMRRYQRYMAEQRARRKRAQSPEEPSRALTAGERPDADADEEDVEWEEQLLDVLMAIPPDSFERLSQRLLREAGFVATQVTGKSGDGGIDGVGTYRISLLSFPVFFQCKRYRGSVSASAVRDFRGAMAGRGDKGLLITTGTFTPSAKAEATRDGAPPIDLIDGQQLCELLKRYELGVETKTRTVEDVTVRAQFFEDL